MLFKRLCLAFLFSFCCRLLIDVLVHDVDLLFLRFVLAALFLFRFTLPISAVFAKRLPAFCAEIKRTNGKEKVMLASSLRWLRYVPAGNLVIRVWQPIYAMRTL